MTPKPIPVKRDGLVVVVTDADLAVLNGLDIELERWCRQVERIRREPIDPAVEGYGLTQGRDYERLTHYHPAGAYPRSSLNALERAGLVESRKKKIGVRWYVTAAGDALLEDRADELGGALCRVCGEEPAIHDLQVEVDPEGLREGIEGCCPHCAEGVLERIEADAVRQLDFAEEYAARERRYIAAAREALDRVPDD